MERREPKGHPQEVTTPVEQPRALSYREHVQRELEGSHIWDYLRYDENGLLWINGTNVIDAVETLRQADGAGTPLEITDTTILRRRCREWETLTGEIAETAGYKGELKYFYAMKANRSSETVNAVVQAGWNLETSSAQDLEDIDFLKRHGLIDPETIKIICNGFKIPDSLGKALTVPETSKSAVVFDASRVKKSSKPDRTYPQNIVRLHNEGFTISPILDTGELKYFTGINGTMDVGVRLKFGKVNNDTELSHHLSRFGVMPDEVDQIADEIAAHPNLQFTMLHTMVGAAEATAVENLVEHLDYAAEKWFALKAEHPTLIDLNIGGGIPPMSEKYDHKALFTQFMQRVQKRADELQLPPPNIVCEFGSYVAAEQGFYALSTILEKSNSVDGNGNPVEWNIVGASLMDSIPDMIIMDKEFVILAANNTDKSVKKVILGDLTCDSGGIYPQQPEKPASGRDAEDAETTADDKEPKYVYVPDADPLLDEPTILVILGIGAYQKQLTGVRGGNHCGLLEAATLIVEERANGKVEGRYVPRQKSIDAQELFGYTDEAAEDLQLTR